MTDRSRHIAVEQEVERGTQALQAAEALLKLGLYWDAATRFYYAVFHFATAALFVDGIEATSHHGVQMLFSQHLVRTGRLAAGLSKDLKRLHGLREASDYERAFVLDQVGAEEEAGVARHFIAQIRDFLNSNGMLPKP